MFALGIAVVALASNTNHDDVSLSTLQIFE
jgi:hypothetical protein